MRVVVILFLTLSHFAIATGLTGKIEIKIEKSSPEKFSFLFWDWTHKTIGPGPSPEINEQDIKDAILEEFKNPQIAIDQLEKLKGPAGKILIEFSYVSACDKNVNRSENDRCQKSTEDWQEIEGKLLFSCGVEEENGEPWINSIDYQIGHWINKPEKKLNHQLADFGKFYQFKWASKQQIKRIIASCLASLRDMPELKSNTPSDPSKIIMDSDIYGDFYKWFSKIQGLKIQDEKNIAFKNSVNCLLKNAIERFRNRTGNILVLERENSVEFFSNQPPSSFIGEHTLPTYLQKGTENKFVYSLAVLDEISWKNLKKNRIKKKIQNQGIWPNIKDISLISLLSQIFGEDLYLNMNACFLSSGIHIYNPVKVIETFYAPDKCEEEFLTNPSFDILELLCKHNDAKSCLLIGQAHANKNLWKCLPNNQNIECSIYGFKSDPLKSEEYLIKACDLGSADGCFNAAKLNPLPSGSFSSQQKDLYQKGCKINNISECEYWIKGVNPTSETEISIKHNECSMNKFKIDSCLDLSIYYQLKQNEEASLKYSKIACERGNTRSLNPNPCDTFANYLLKQNNKKGAIQILENNCWFKTDKSCNKLYDLYDKVKKDELIKKICWETKIKCF
jgi:hypothetical protein